MKIIISTINSKYIHINNSVYIIQKYLDQKSYIKTYTLKDDVNNILKELIEENADYYFFSVYIWNIDLYKIILPKLKKELPNSKIIIGGPEVSYDGEYLLDVVDFIYRGEVNESINEIINSQVKSAHIVKDDYKLSKCNYNNYVHDIDYFNNIKIDKNQIVYLETSRGCPFKCSYCMSSLETSVNNLELDKVYKLIDFVIKNKVNVVKFLDRTFNMDEERVKLIMNYIIENALPYQSFQFEVAPELISNDLLEYLKNIEGTIFRFEVGIQSVHNETVNAVDRFHSYEKYENTLQILCNETNIVTHFDLIAGLPYETLPKFKDSFNKTFKLLPDEYQLGMLKVLNGTKMKSEVQLHNIVYESNAPYQFISNKYISEDECKIIEQVEDIVDRFYNSKKFNTTFNSIINRHNNIFDTLLLFNKFIVKNNFKLLDYQLYDIYKIFYEFLLEYDKDIADYVIFDYVSVVKNKPKRFYQTISRERLSEILNAQVNEEYSLNYLYKYMIVEELSLDQKTIIIKDVKTNKIKIEK